MNNADLVWRLVELLLQKEKDLNQVALDKANNHKPNDHKQDEAQLAEIIDNVALSQKLHYLFLCKKDKD